MDEPIKNGPFKILVLRDLLLLLNTLFLRLGRSEVGAAGSKNDERSKRAEIRKCAFHRNLSATGYAGAFCLL